MIDARISPSTVLKPCKRCVVRQHVDRTVLYNPTTDELHLVLPTGLFVFRLCNGLRSVGEIVDFVGRPIANDRGEARERVIEFLGQLVDRGLLEVQNG